MLASFASLAARRWASFLAKSLAAASLHVALCPPSRFQSARWQACPQYHAAWQPAQDFSGASSV